MQMALFNRVPTFRWMLPRRFQKSWMMVCPIWFDILGGIGGLIEAAAKAAISEQPRVAVCGEGVALLHAEGKADAAIRIERGCNDLTKTYEVDILCAYPLSSFHGVEDEHDFQIICAEHSAVYSE